MILEIAQRGVEPGFLAFRLRLLFIILKPSQIGQVIDNHFCPRHIEVNESGKMLRVVDQYIREILIPLKYAARQLTMDRFELAANARMPGLQPVGQVVFPFLPKETNQLVEIVLFFIHAVWDIKGGQVKQAIHPHRFGQVDIPIGFGKPGDALRHLKNQRILVL